MFKGDEIMNDATIDWESELRDNLLFQLHIHYKYKKEDLKKKLQEICFAYSIKNGNEKINQWKLQKVLRCVFLQLVKK